MNLSNALMSEALSTAQRAARAGGAVVRAQFGQRVQITPKSAFEDRTTTDVDAEAAIFEVIRERYPDHRIRSEELGDHQGASDFVWIIDPLDGTSNFILGIPHVAVCVSFAHNENILASVIYQPITNTMYWASAHSGAYLDGAKLTAALEGRDLGTSTICNILTYSMHNRPVASQAVYTLHYGTRRLLDTWAPSLDWCLLASGKVDGIVYLSDQLMCSDTGMLAGAFLWLEAGGALYRPDGQKIARIDEALSVVAAAPALVNEICRTVNFGDIH